PGVTKPTGAKDSQLIASHSTDTDLNDVVTTYKRIGTKDVVSQSISKSDGVTTTTDFFYGIDTTLPPGVTKPTGAKDSQLIASHSTDTDLNDTATTYKRIGTKDVVSKSISKSDG